MSTITVQAQLVEQLEQAASERSMMPEELLETALRDYLRQLDRDKIKTEAEAFRDLHSALLKEYPGQYVAIHNGELVDHDEDFQALHRRVRQRFGRQPVLLRQVGPEPERVWTFRSPQFERGQP